MADVSLVDAAVIARLASDAALQALCPDGVWYSVAPQDSTAFVIVARMDHSIRPAQDATTEYTLYEQAIYLVKAVLRHTAATTAAQAAARIHALLHHAELDLTAAGYTAMLCHCIEPLRLPEVDRITNTTWQHEGGQYELWSYPTS